MNRNKPDTPYTGDTSAGVRRGRGGRRAPVEGAQSRRGLFLLVDALLLVAVLAAVFFLVVLLTPLELFGGNDVEERRITYTVELAGVDRALIEVLRVGDSVVDAKTGSVIGEVTAVDSRPYEVYTDIPTTDIDEALNTHIVTKNTYPEEFNTVTVTLRVTADYRPGEGYTAEDCRIAVGRNYDLRFPAYAGSGMCVTLVAE